MMLIIILITNTIANYLMIIIIEINIIIIITISTGWPVGKRFVWWSLWNVFTRWHHRLAA